MFEGLAIAEVCMCCKKLDLQPPRVHVRCSWSGCLKRCSSVLEGVHMCAQTSDLGNKVGV